MAKCPRLRPSRIALVTIFLAACLALGLAASSYSKMVSSISASPWRALPKPDVIASTADLITYYEEWQADWLAIAVPDPSHTVRLDLPHAVPFSADAFPEGFVASLESSPFGKIGRAHV